MGLRIDLQHKLEKLLGSNNVYFQPPPNVKMKYPCIVYHLDGAITRFADDNPYFYQRKYQLTYIDRNPDSPLVDELAMMKMTSLQNWTAVDGLNHYNYSIYF